MNPKHTTNLPPIKDIKPLVEIPDHSAWIYWGLWIFTGLLIVGAIYWLVIWLRSHKKINKEHYYLEVLNNIDWSDPKKDAYTITKYGNLLANDERRKEIFEQLLPRLEPFKYRKEVGSVDWETKRRFELFKQVCDESL